MLVVANQEKNDTQIYFDPVQGSDMNNPSEGEFRSPVTLGTTPKKPKKNEDQSVPQLNFTITLLSLDSELTKYLSSTNGEENQTWWQSTDWPVGAETLDTLNVTRDGPVTGDC